MVVDEFPDVVCVVSCFLEPYGKIVVVQTIACKLLVSACGFDVSPSPM